MDLESRLAWLEQSVGCWDGSSPTLREEVAALVRDFQASLNAQTRAVLVTHHSVLFSFVCRCLFGLFLSYSLEQEECDRRKFVLKNAVIDVEAGKEGNENTDGS